MTEGSVETNRIERDLEATRARLDATIGALQQRLSPGQLLDQSLAYLKDSGGGEFGRNLKLNIQAHPMPVALIGIGLAWLMMGGNVQRPTGEAWRDELHGGDANPHDGDNVMARVEAAASGVKRTASETAEAFQERRYAAKGTALGISRGVGDTFAAFSAKIDAAVRAAGSGGRATARTVRDAAGSATDAATSAAQGVRDATQRAAGYLQDQPLLLGAVGVSVGALLAAMLPPSRTEDELLGGLRDSLRDRAGEVAGAAMAGGARVAEETFDAGAETARREGLTKDDVGDAAAAAAPRMAEAAAGARHVVEDALTAGRDALGRELRQADDRRPADPVHGV